MIRSITAYYLQHPTTVAYMLQSTEYDVSDYIKWYWRTQDFSKIMRRRVLDPTKRARLLRAALKFGMGVQIIAGISLVIAGIIYQGYPEVITFGVALLISYPVVWAHLVVIPLILAKLFVVKPRDKKLIAASEKIFKDHKAVKIAVAGSYGKTTMKELLATILSEGMKVAATPANRNVAISHAQFARNLKGDEEVLIIEYGEGEPGDVARFSRTTHPTYAFITGLAPAHLDKYKTLQNAAKDIFSVSTYVEAGNVFANGESPDAQPYLQKSFHAYDRSVVGDWKVDDVKVDIDGTSFKLTNTEKDSKQSIDLHTKLLGKHQIGPISAAAVLGLKLGMTVKQIQKGVERTSSYEHRMNPYTLGGAWIIDDTYNGNLEGVRAGTELLAELNAKRKWYVSPGLVGQGKETARVHTEMGRLIAKAAPDMVVLMKNSVTSYIEEGLKESGYKGEVRVQSDPLEFYKNLEHFVTKGDVVLMQNDWTDNYA